MRITVLGGAGKMGCIAVQHLVNDPRVDEVVIADLNVEQAQEVAAILDSPKLSIRRVDLADRDDLIHALRGSQSCLNATVYYTNLPVMEACLAAQVSYVDLGGLFHTTRRQLELHDDFAAAGISAVLGMGSAPGIPNVQARFGADRLDRIESIRIYDGIKPPPPGASTFTYAVATILDELTLAPVIFRDGQFVTCQPMSEFEDYAFAAPLGVLPMHLSLHSEPATLPITYGDRGLRECFFKINYWGMDPELVAKVRVLAEFGMDSREPVNVRGQQIAPRDLLMALLGNKVPPIGDFLAPPANQPPDWVKEIVTEIRGTKDGEPMTWRVGTLTTKGSLPTGVAPAIAAIWLAGDRIPVGVFPPEAVIEPEPFFAELREAGIPTQVSVTHRL